MVQPARAPIYQDGSLTVGLEPNPAGAGSSQAGGDQQAISAEQLAVTIKGLYVRKKAGFLQSVVVSQPEPVFREDELSFVAGELQKGLKQASPQERVAFQLRRPRGRGREETSGAIYLRGGLLYVTLAKFRSPDAVTYKDAEYGSGTDFELLYEPSEAVVRKQQSFASQWLGPDPTEVIVDIQKVAGSSTAPPKMETTDTPPALPAVTVEALQRQIKELTEEITRLRQELAEVKQLLADKVLELNRLQGKQ